MANRGASYDTHVFSISDLKEAGSARLPVMYSDYFNGGAMDLISMQDNEAAFDRVKLRPRILKNVANLDPSTTILGIKVPFPCGFSPSAMHCLAHPDGEVATSKAAASQGVPMCLSSYSTSSLEDVAAVSNGNPMAIQMCIVNDRNVTLQLLRRAEKAGYKALFLSVDVPVLGVRLNEMRNQFVLPEGMTFPNIIVGESDDTLVGKEGGAMAYDASLEWDEIVPWLRKNTKMEIWFKGVTSPEDVQKAIDFGVDGVIISNHGGRQLDGMPATLDALRECAPIAKGKIQLGFDGGIRRGSDIFKAIALGADFVLMGRVPIWGLAYKGQEGVELAVKILFSEFKSVMALTGCRTIADITSDHLSIFTNGMLAKL